MVEADLKKEIFVFDHVAHPLTSQADIYQMIGAEAVSTCLQVDKISSRDTTAASLPMDKQEQVKVIRSWGISQDCKEIPIAPQEVSFPDCWKTFSTPHNKKSRPIRSPAPTSKYTMNRSTTSYHCHHSALAR